MGMTMEDRLSCHFTSVHADIEPHDGFVTHLDVLPYLQEQCIRSQDFFF